MAREFSRTQRVGGQIQRELAQLIQQEIRDPRVGMVTISDVKVTRDLAHAKVYVTFMDLAQDVSSALEGLNHAAGYLRRHLGQRMMLRIMPQLHFVHDTTVETGNRLEALIAKVAAERDPQVDESQADLGANPTKIGASHQDKSE